MNLFTVHSVYTNERGSSFTTAVPAEGSIYDSVAFSEGLKGAKMERQEVEGRRIRV